MTTTNDSTPAPTPQTPAELREALERKLNGVRNSPARSLVEAHIATHDESEPERKLGWVLETLVDESDVLQRAKAVTNAVKVFNGISFGIEKELAPFEVTELMSTREAVLADPNSRVLTGWAAATIASPGDDLETNAFARRQLRKALEIAERVMSGAQRSVQKAGVLVRVMDCVRTRFDQNWSAELDGAEKFVADKTANEEQPYVPWKRFLLDDALRAADEGSVALADWLHVDNHLGGLIIAIDTFEKVLSRAGQELFLGEPRLRQEFEELKPKKGGETKPATAPTQSAPLADHMGIALQPVGYEGKKSRPRSSTRKSPSATPRKRLTAKEARSKSKR